MAIRDALLSELDHEFAGTRRTLERVPMDRATWKPHPKSMALAALATHLSRLPQWLEMTLAHPDVDLATADVQTMRTLAGSREELLAWFDRNLAAGRERLAAADDAHLLSPWSLRTGEVIHFTMPRVAAVRGFIFNHNIHHRGQLTVYLRLLDVPVPALYGPSADESGA